MFKEVWKVDIEAITNLISALGFPVACVVAMGFFIWMIYKQSVAREDKLYTELAASRIVNEKAIDTIAHYAEKLGVIKQDVSDIKTDVTILTEKIS